jgi:regulatory protein
MVVGTITISDGRQTWHKKGVNGQRKTSSGRRRAAPALNERTLHELALRYVGRFATTRGKLRAYLGRKLRERGWDGAQEPDLAVLADRFASEGYVDDAGYALSRAEALAARGYGKRRLLERLRTAGVEEQDTTAAREHTEREALASALRFAERRRIGPYASAVGDMKEREKALAAMVRAGHPFGLARAIVSLPAGGTIDLDELADRAG